MYDLKDHRWIKNVQQLRSSDKSTVLTFDDGPGRYTNRILDILKAKQVPAMFFWQSKLFYTERPWKRVINEGHTIQSHAHNHKNLIQLSKEQQYDHIKKSITIIESITGKKVQYFRPPFGQYNEDTMLILDELNLQPVMWEICSYDWEHKNSPDQIITNVCDYARYGSIILLHELKQTVKVLPQLVDCLKKKGFRFTIL
ncbi:polysaccharide deacetylase family protein [Bacillus shivajii]|uniref:polysaccharide deacetylase family protein n=1 Tax=Bacillus shivajii TaxID=1983719 RepID=UPI001CF97B7A|nr:polysaccharide deacetylase family protein [Bacillus shivajii]UCZ54136.1 polysaccharide deacetylase family protein [Bacillus shivajii]